MYGLSDLIIKITGKTALAGQWVINWVNSRIKIIVKQDNVK